MREVASQLGIFQPACRGMARAARSRRPGLRLFHSRSSSTAMSERAPPPAKTHHARAVSPAAARRRRTRGHDVRQQAAPRACRQRRRPGVGPARQIRRAPATPPADAATVDTQPQPQPQPRPKTTTSPRQARNPQARLPRLHGQASTGDPAPQSPVAAALDAPSSGPATAIIDPGRPSPRHRVLRPTPLTAQKRG